MGVGLMEGLYTFNADSVIIEISFNDNEMFNQTCTYDLENNILLPTCYPIEHLVNGDATEFTHNVQIEANPNQDYDSCIQYKYSN